MFNRMRMGASVGNWLGDVFTTNSGGTISAGGTVFTESGGSSYKAWGSRLSNPAVREVLEFTVNSLSGQALLGFALSPGAGQSVWVSNGDGYFGTSGAAIVAGSIIGFVFENGVIKAYHNGVFQAQYSSTASYVFIAVLNNASVTLRTDPNTFTYTYP